MFLSKDQLTAIARAANPHESATLALARVTGMPITEAEKHPAAQELNWMMREGNQPRQADEMTEFDPKLAPDRAIHHRTMTGSTA